MLQRLVRSIVSTAPRPYLIDEVPWLCSLSVTAGKSRPGNSDSMRRRNAGLIASVSTNVPWIGQVFSTIDLAVALENVRLDLADLLVDQRFDRPVRPTGCGRALRARRWGTANRSCAASRAAASSARGSSAAARSPISAETASPSNLRLIAWNAGHSSLAPPVSASSTGFHGFINDLPSAAPRPFSWSAGSAL